MTVAKPTPPPSEAAAHAVARGGAYEDEGSGDRVVHHRYTDPLDLIWIAAARRMGMQVQRSDAVFASWDGARVLTLSTPEGFDPDDSVAQLVLHECCHALVEDARAWGAPDWGLENTDDRDLSAEHAAQRVQAALATPHGLRTFLAATTKWRDHYDSLPPNPLEGPASDPAVALAQAAFARAQRPPWGPALQDALHATAAVAAATRSFASAESLWSVVPAC